MIQTIAIFVDAYRELNARRLFWITLLLSGLVVVGMACLGVNEEGLTILFWTIPFFGIDSTVLPPDLFYKSVFMSMGVNLWLSIFASILALVSTASLVPDLISSGAIELSLSKPISRARLFLTKYVTGLMFATLQVVVFTVASFVLIGVRGGAWEPSLFLAVPLVACFFSYLFSICALVGLLTRSTLTALLLTMLAWVGFFGLHTTESIVYGARIAVEREIELVQKDIERREIALARFEETVARVPANDTRRHPGPMSLESQVQAKRDALESRRVELEDNVTEEKRWTKSHRVILGLKTILPKTTETIALLERSLIDMADLPEADADVPRGLGPMSNEPAPINVSALGTDVLTQVAMEGRERSVAWIVGTSLGFEIAILAIATLVFVRRDF